MKGDPLKKELGLLSIYAIATGATLSSGFFLLPGLAAAEAGSALPLAYLIAGMMIVPGILSMAELATAMPRSGGVYYFVDRSLGPLFGTVAGFGTWTALVLKTAFALVGVGAYLSLYLPDIDVSVLAGSFALVFGVVNMLGARSSGSAQVILVFGLLTLLLWFTGIGVGHIDASNFSGFFDAGSDGILATAGLVVVSYMGLTKIASIAEEVRDPEKNMPRGMFMSLLTALLVYTVGTVVMIGVVSVDGLTTAENVLTPVVTVAHRLMGNWGGVIMTGAAILAFSSVGNAGILSASRYPLAMSRDSLLPAVFSRISSRGTPLVAVVLTTATILLMVTLLDPRKIAKLAGSFQLLMFILSSISVIVMRESRLDSYDPSYRAPLYPWVQIVGVIAPIWLIAEMGILPVLFTVGLVLLGTLWYGIYARPRVNRSGAIRHAFASISAAHFQRGSGAGIHRRSSHSVIDEVIMRSAVIDVRGDIGFDEITLKASEILATRVSFGSEKIFRDYCEVASDGILSVSPGIVLAHIHVPNIIEAELVLVRSSRGIVCKNQRLITGQTSSDPRLNVVIYLVSPRSNPGHHLKVLSRLADRVTTDEFLTEWTSAPSEDALRRVLLQEENFITIHVGEGRTPDIFVGRRVRDLNLPDELLLVSVLRGGRRIIPRGDTVLARHDHITILGDPRSLLMYRRTLSG
jgi:basic amino acid/polyamine antiporter, APA family